MSFFRWFLLACAFLVGACAEPMSPADLAKNEVHPYPGRTKAEVFKASVAALKTLGYEVVTTDAASGRIKTSPKLVTVTAYGNGTTAVASANSVAWTLEVSDVSGGASVNAEPRGYSAGQAVGPERMNAAFLERTFATLYSEIDDNLPLGKPAAAETPAPKATDKPVSPKKNQKMQVAF
jgi:hypothetical protein